MVALYIYVDGIAKRIELFDDEKISLTSSVQDISDVSKAKTDFTQSFTVVASPTNNEIFKHWYESSIDGGFDHRVKYNGYIEIDTRTFREGAFGLNDVKYKDNMVDSYSIVFYGKAKNIKDILKEDKLANLDFSSLNHTFTSTEVINRITTSTGNVSYPLFAHDRIYDYNNASANDITTNAGSIKWNSLFPAIPLSEILSRISTKYDLNFTGAFLDYPQFTKLWMLFKNAESFSQKLTPLRVNFTAKSSTAFTEMNLTTDEVGLMTRSGFINYRYMGIAVTTASTQPYDILIYKNGVLDNSFVGVVGSSGTRDFFTANITTQNRNDKYSVYISSQSGFSFTTTLVYNIGIGAGPLGTGPLVYTATSSTQTISSTIDIGGYAPDLKLIDLITGLIKMFNLVIIPQDETTYELIPLELYYNDGRYNDISANVISDDIELKKTSMYKNINFKYQKSENILNTKFNDLFLSTRNFAYGDLAYEQIDSLESGTFSVELPFENAMYERKTGSNFQTLTFKKIDLANYLPKPLLMYDNGVQGVSPNIRIDLTTGGHSSITQYRRFSNDYSNGTILTLNWGEEISTWFLSNVSNGLYKRHYENYLGNIFNIKSRLVIVKCYFNPVELIDIKLNDRIIIRDKKYTINKMTTDLTSGETTMELLTDYRSGEVPIGNRFSLEPFYEVDNTAQTIEILLLRNVSPTISMAGSDFGWISYLGEIYTEDTTISVSISANTSGVQRIGYVGGKWNDELGNILDIEIPIIQNA
jgi:hypothetical protein